MNISTQEMTKQEWLKERQKGIFSTDVAAILGLDPYKTPLKVYLEKIAETPVEIPDNPRMKAGRNFESAIADWFSEETGYKLIRDNKIRFLNKYPFGANIDRLIVHRVDGKIGYKGTGILEVKTASEFAYKKWEEEVPKMYWLQVQHALNVTGHKWGNFALWVAGMDLQIIPFERDQEIIEMITPELLKFWNENVLKRIPPEPINEEDIKRLYPRSEIGKTIEVSDETYKIVKDLNYVKFELKKQEIEKDKYTEQLKLMMKDAEVLTYGGEIILTWKTSKPSIKFNTDRFKKDHFELYNSYLDEVPGSRRFLLK